MQAPLGIFTTDDRLVVRAWDDWLALATGIAPHQARDRHLTEIIPDLASRGILPIFETVLSRGTVAILAPALHHYLIACAPQRPVDGFSQMQQHVTIGPLRDDGRVVGLMVTIEDVTARVADERHLAAHIDGLTRLLGDEDWRTRRAAVTTLASHGEAIVESLVDTLRTQHRNLAVLSSALDLLAVSDIDVIDPLVACLADPDANLRIQAALILGERRDPRAIGPLMSRLDDPDANVQFHAIEALATLQATEACEALLAIAEARDFFLAFPAIQALGRVGNPSIAPRLVPLLADDLLRAPVIEILGELGDEDVVGPLLELLNTSGAPADVIADALAGLYERYESRYGAGDHIASLVRRGIRAAGTQRILDAVRELGADRLPSLAKVLSWLEGDAVQRALTRLLGHGAVRSQVVEALVRHGSGVVALLIEQLRAEDLETRQAAAVALGRIGDRRATQALVGVLRDAELAVPVAGALARIGDRTAFEPLLELLGTPDAATRQAAVAALNSIGHPDMPPRIATLLENPDPLVRESALRIAGYFGYPECLERVLDCCHDASEAVRRTAIESVAFFEHARVVPALVDALERDTPAVRAAAAAALGRVEGAGVAGALTGALHDADPWVRYLAVRSLGTMGDPSVGSEVLDLLRNDPAPHVRLAAIEVLGRLRPAEALEVLLPLAESSDRDIGAAAIRALGNIAGPDALGAVEKILRAPEAWQRSAAVMAATARSEPRVAQLLQWTAAADDDRHVAAAAVEALATLSRREDQQGQDATRALTALAREASVREAVIRALGDLPPRRLGEVAAGLTDRSPDVRRACIEALSRMKHPDASRALEAALDDAEAVVRLAAVKELKQLGTRSARRKLLSLARKDADVAVRHAAMLAAARSGESGFDVAQD